MRFLPRYLSAIAGIALFPATAPAQVPLGYLAVSESPPVNATAVRYVDPATGVATELRAAGVNAPLASGSLTVDPADPMALYTVPTLSTSIAVSLMDYNLQGSRYTGVRRVTVPGVGGAPKRLWSLGTTVLATIPTNTGGLWSIDTATATSARLAPLSNATDIAVVGNLAYANSYRAGQPSTIVEVDLVTNQTRTVSTTLPTIRSLGVFPGPSLIGGTDTGDLVLIDVVSGNTSVLISPNAGAVIAIASDPTSSLPYFATARNEIRSFASPVIPIYTAAGAIQDIDVGVHPLPAHLLFGDGCVGSTGQMPQFSYIDVPGLGGSYTLETRNGIAGMAAVLAAGFSRTSFGSLALPMPLWMLLPGAGPQCLVQTDVVASAFQILDLSGSARVVLNVPNNQLLVGQHVTWQWLHLDAMAPGGAVVSDGAESIVR